MPLTRCQTPRSRRLNQVAGVWASASSRRMPPTESRCQAASTEPGCQAPRRDETPRSRPEAATGLQRAVLDEVSGRGVPRHRHLVIGAGDPEHVPADKPPTRCQTPRNRTVSAPRGNTARRPFGRLPTVRCVISASRVLGASRHEAIRRVASRNLPSEMWNEDLNWSCAPEVLSLVTRWWSVPPAGRWAGRESAA
jgi:hypothetical protein